MNRADWLNHLHALPEGENLTESPIELALHRTLLKYLAVGGVFAAGEGITSGRLYPQVHLPTRGGAFRADFLLVAGSQITLIECDGASFHADPFDDHLRSAFIFEAGLVDQVIRFNGTMLHHSPHDAVLWTSVVAPAAFWAEAEAKLRRAATPEGVQAVDRLRHELNQGYSSFDYSVSTEDTDFSASEEGTSRRADFSGLYHNGQPNKTRAGELIDTLRRCDATSLESLERTYWAEVKDRDQEAVADLHEAIFRSEDAESGPATREHFDQHWATLVDRFQPRRPLASPEVYFAALSTLRYASQMERAFKYVFRYAEHFPTPAELREAAHAKPDRRGLW